MGKKQRDDNATDTREEGGEEIAETITLDDFCRVLSTEAKQVELISGFHHEELANGRISATTADYRARFRQFADRPAA